MLLKSYFRAFNFDSSFCNYEFDTTTNTEQKSRSIEPYLNKWTCQIYEHKIDNTVYILLSRKKGQNIEQINGEMFESSPFVH